jgi:NodT family efflux transporter outer membrane factor (OMF) lipoprotein
MKPSFSNQLAAWAAKRGIRLATPVSSGISPAALGMALASVSMSLAVVLLGGCRVGPKYVAPKAMAPPAYKESSPAAYSNAPAGTWQPAQPQDAMIKGKWWEVFNEPELNTLEDQLNINNQNIATYFQNFMAARSIVREAHAGFYPTLSVAPSYIREKSPSTLRGVSTVAGTTTGGTGTGGTGTGTGGTAAVTSSGVTSTDLSLPFDVSWEPDLWGKIRNTVREYQYATQVSAADLENERLTEQANLAEYYFELRGQDSLQNLYDQTIHADQQSLDLTKTLYETGIDSEEDVAEAELTLDNAKEAGAGVATNRAIYEHAIATLVGKPASSFSLPVKQLSTKPPQIPLGVPSQLLQRRPDIAAAERTMAEANALIGVEQAAFYPTLSLTGSGGLQSSRIGTLFTTPALFWSLGSSAAETIFDGGLRRATVAQYTAQYNADAATYRETVLTAFQQVEDYISTLRVTSQQVDQEERAVGSAQRYVNLATTRYKTGLDPYLDVITAQNTLLSDQQTQVSLRVSEMTAAVELVQALGGGWDVTQLPAAAKVNSSGATRQVQATP